jgi:hypothetical protein
MTKCLSVKFATYNLLNTKDRYLEREALLKQNLYDLRADLVGIQEVVYGPDMLDELKHAKGQRTETSHDHGFACYTAPVQLPIFALMNNPDPRANLDGNCILLSDRVDSVIKP